MDRTILHCDCNSFFASVETLLDPSLADGPTAVCGDPESRHGIILAKNEKAKAFGVQTAETIWQAKRKCPDLRLVAPHRSEYVKFSRKCNELYLQYTDLVDPFGIDESFLDVTGSMHLFGSGEHIADELRRRMREEVGLTISVGVSFNRSVRQARQRLQKAGRHDGLFARKFQAARVDLAREHTPVCRQTRQRPAEPTGRAHDRRAGGLRSGVYPQHSGQKRRSSAALRQRRGR